MARSRIIAGKAVIIIEAQDLVNKTLGKLRSNLHRFSNEVGKIGEGLFRTGFFGALGSGAVINSFVKFDDAMRTLRVNLDLFGKSSREVEETLAPLEARIRSLAQTTPFNPTQVAQAATELAKGGFDPKQIEKALQAVLDLARATNTELGFSAEFVVRTLTTYGIATENAAEVVSQLVRASRKGTLGIEDLEAAMRYSSGTADTLGVSLQKMLAIFTVLSNRGLVGSIAGTSTNTAFSQLVKKAQELKDIGKIELVTGFRKDGREALDVISSLENLFKFAETLRFTEQQTLFQDVFNLRGARSVSAIRREIDNIKKLTGFIADANDEARVAAEIQDAGIGGSLRRLVSTIQELGIALGQTVEKPVVNIANTIKGLLTELNKLATLNPTLTSLVILSPGILLAAGAGMIVLAKGLRVAAFSAGLLKAGLAPLSRFLAKGTVGQITTASRGLNALRSVSAAGFGGKIYKGMESLSNRLNTLPPILKQVIRLFTSLSFLTASFAFPGLGQLTKTTLILTSLRSIKQAIAAIYSQTALFVRGGGLYNMMMRATNVKNPFIGLGAALKGVATYINGIKSSLARGNLAAALNPKPLLVIRGLFASTNLPRFGLALSNVTKSITTAARGLLAFGSIFRRVFSLTGLTTIIEILILFGDKIPGVNTALASLGKGFSNAFKEISKVGALVSGPLSLFRASIEAFNAGDSEAGVQGLFDSFSSLASIIGNQLVAAWNRFKEAIAPTVDLVSGLFRVISAIVDSLGSSIGVIIASGVRTLNALAGGNEITGGASKGVNAIIEGMALLTIKLFNWIAEFAVTFNQVSQLFIADIERVFTKLNPFNNANKADALFEARQGQINAEAKVDFRILKDNLAKNSLAIINAFQSSKEISKSNAEAAINRASAASQTAFINAGATLMAAYEAANPKPTPGTTTGFPQGIDPTPLDNPAVKAMQLIADALVGSVQSTRRNLLRTGKPIEEKQLEEQKRTNELLEKQLKDQGVLFAP